MRAVLGTFIVGGAVILFYKTVNFIFNSCYMYKIPYYEARHSLVTNSRQCVRTVVDILNRRPRAFRVVGMDCEMTSTSQHGGHPVPALLQLAKPDGFCAIFQLKVIESTQDRIIAPYLSDSPKTFKYKFPSENIIRIENSYSWLRRLSWDEKTYWKYSLKLWRDYIGKQFEFSPQSSFKFEHRDTWISYIPKHILSYSRRYESIHFESSISERHCFVCGNSDDSPLNLRLKPIVTVDYSVNIEDKKYENCYYICLCSMCFEDSRTNVDYELRQELTEECGAPYPNYKDYRLEIAKKLAMELLSSGNSSKERTDILEHNLQELLPDLSKDEFQIRTMEIILSMDCWPDSDHGRFVHDYFYEYGGLKELKFRWCERFWTVMEPHYMPRRWENYYDRLFNFSWMTK